MNDHTCPVCGYDHLEYGTDTGDLCPSCGTMFGVDDDAVDGKPHAELRADWIAGGMKWWAAKVGNPPAGWNAQEQLDLLLATST